MQGSRFGIAGAAMAALLGSLAWSPPVGTSTGPIAQEASREAARQSPADSNRDAGSAVQRAIRKATGSRPAWSPGPWPSSEGWTNARYQRAARKRRNQLRNKRAHRG